MINLNKISIFSIFALVTAGCSGGNGSLPTPQIRPPSGPTSPTISSIKTGASFIFKIPSSSAVKTQSVQPLHLPSSTNSLLVTVTYGTGATTGTPGTNTSKTNFDATTCPKDSSGAKTCTVNIPLKADSYNVDIIDFNGPGQTGSLLSRGSSNFTVADGTFNTIPLTLIGIPASIAILPDGDFPANKHFNYIASSGTYELAGPVAQPLRVYGVDADGNTIVTGEPILSNVTAVSNAPTSVAVSAPIGTKFTAQSLNLKYVNVSVTAVYNGITLTTSNGVTPVEEMYVSGGSKVEGYAMFTSGMKLVETQSFSATGANMDVRSDAARKTLTALDVTNGALYTNVESAPVKLFTSVNATNANDFAIAPGGGSYYVSIRNNNAVYQLSSGSGSLLNTYPVSQPIDIDFDAAGNLFAAQINFNGTIAKLPAGGTGFSTFISGLYYPAALRIGNAANGNFLYESFDNGSGQVGIYNNTTNTGVGGLQGSSFGFNAAGENFIINGYVTPVVLNVYSPNSNVANAGRSFTFPAGASTGNFDFLI